MDNVVPIRPGIHPFTMPTGAVVPVHPAGQAAGDVSPWSIIGWVIVGLIAWEGGKYALSEFNKKTMYSARRR